jgi:hypothetical protein
MSKPGGWVPIDKGLVKTLTKIDRPYSEVEAMFSHTVDVDCGKPWTIKGYAKLWNWSRGKVRRFIENMRTQSGHLADRKGTQSGHPVHFIDQGLWGEADIKRTQSGHLADTKQYPTINPNPNPNPKKEKEAPFQAIVFLKNMDIDEQLAKDFLKNRTKKRLANTLTAFNGLQREINKTKLPANEIITICCEKGWGSFKASWDYKEKKDGKPKATTQKQKQMQDLSAMLEASEEHDDKLRDCIENTDTFIRALPGSGTHAGDIKSD